MARNVSTIQNQILNAVANNPNLSALNSTSQVAIYRLWAFIMASSMAVEEQLYDQFVADVEAIQLILPPGSLPWIQNQAFLFQYSDTDPQILTLNTTTFVPEYAQVIIPYRLITNCSVTQGVLNSVNIKVAKGYSTTTSPQALTTSELAAFQSYMNYVKPAGVVYNCFSQNADRLKTAVTVRYRGMYSSTIAAALQLAYNSYLQSIPFDGVVKLIDMLIALRSVTGVIDVFINECAIRSYAAGYGGGVNMVFANTTNYSEYSTVAGYVVDEDTTSNTFTDLLTLIAV